MDSRLISEKLIEKYYKTFSYPFTHHQINSYDQFISSDVPAIIKSFNPIIILQDKIGTSKNEDIYAYTTEIFVGGLNGDRYYIGTPTVSLKNNTDVRVLFPNEARLRNLTYASNIEVDIVIKVTFARLDQTLSKQESLKTTIIMDPIDKKYEHLGRINLFKVPLMLHSRYCLLHNKPNLFLREVGECPYDYGGYFIVDGSEKVLITRQEQAFNTLYITKQEKNPKVEIYASIQCLNPTTRQVKRIAFSLDRRNNVLYVSIPFVRKPLPAFVLFRALGVQSDNDILRLIFHNENDIETTMLEPYLHETLLESRPFMDQYSAVQYIKLLTKGFSEAHVYDIILNQLFIHVENKPMNKAYFLADSIRRILRVKANIDKETDKDDIRNQRCLTSGFLTKMLFQNIYKSWVKFMSITIDKEYKYNVSNYSGENFLNLFLPGNISTLFQLNYITDGISKGFKGKWKTGPSANDTQTGALQPLSRLSYLDFLSHCRRVNLDFDTSMKLQGPRRLHTTQFGYFCTSETPGGSSIGITKNLSNFTAISLGMEPQPFINWLVTKMNVILINDLTAKMMNVGVPIYVNAGIIGYTFENPFQLVKVCKLLKYTGCLPSYSSIAFNIRQRLISFYFDEGRPVRPLIHIENGKYPSETLLKTRTWNELVKGTYSKTKEYDITNSIFIDPLKNKENVSFEDYTKELSPYIGVLEYLDPYESNESYIAMYPEEIQRETTHVELHPSTIVGLLTSMIPFPNHNQSPRNQLSCSQSKQGVSVYSTAFKNRFDNQTHILCYGEAPLVRTLYYDYVADGMIGYGHNLTLALGCFTGYNQEDGIVMNADTFQRGMFRNMTYRSYEAFEEDNIKANTKTRIANPFNTPGWTQLKPGIDYTKLDERGIIKKGEYVDENTVLVGRFIQAGLSDMRDASLTAQVWTSGIVEDVVVTINNAGLALVKIRVIQDRVPELGDKFSNRHGQKGTIGMLVRAADMPRTANGLVPDMIMNPHAIPSRMTIAQLLESLLGKVACQAGFIGDATAFMNESGIEDSIGKVLQNKYGLQKHGEELMYDGTTGAMIPMTMFVGTVYTMRLKHMVEDKWNARGEGRREIRTHQPTGGRGNQGGLRIGEMERDAITAHGISAFLRESFMKRADGTTIVVCNGCGTVPIINPTEKFEICPLCSGPLQFIGETPTNLELLPTMKRSITSFSKVEIPFSFELFNKELNTYMNMYVRYLTTKDVSHFRKTQFRGLKEEEIEELLNKELPQRILKDLSQPEMREEEVIPEMTKEEEEDLGVLPSIEEENIDENEEPLSFTSEANNNSETSLTTEQNVQIGQNGQTVMVPQPPITMTVSQPPVAMKLVPQNEVLNQEGGGNDPNKPYVLMPLAPSIAPMSIIQTGIPNAPATLVIDTSKEAMEAEGFTREIQSNGSSFRSITKKPNSASSTRSRSPSFSVNKMGSDSSTDTPANGKSVYNVVKEGQ